MLASRSMVGSQRNQPQRIRFEFEQLERYAQDNKDGTTRKVWNVPYVIDQNFSGKPRWMQSEQHWIF